MTDVRFYSDKLKEKAAQGNVQAISLLTGVTRQTLYRWKRQGETITLEKVQKLLSDKKDHAEVWGPRRGRPILIKSQRYLPGLFSKNEKMRARKDLSNAIADLNESIELARQRGATTKNQLISLRFVLPKLIEVIPPDLRTEIFTPVYPTKTGKNG